MAITSVGYAGTVTDADWRVMAAKALGSMYGVDGFAAWRVTPTTGDRTVSITAGIGFGLGVVDTSDAPVTKQLATVASGSRWDLIVAHRDWSTKVTSFEVIQGSATKALPARATGFGTTNDQPIALVRVAAGQTAVQEIVDLRCIPGDGGLVAFDDLARQYLDRVGTSVRIGNVQWDRTLNTQGSPIWARTDVTADTGWVDVARNDGWVWTTGRVRRIGGEVFFQLSATRSVGWVAGNQLALIPVGFRPDQDWWAGNSFSDFRHFVFQPSGDVLAGFAHSGPSVTLYGSYPAA